MYKRQTWYSTLTVPQFQAETGGAEYTDAFQATHPEQVFVDGESQVQVAANPGAGQFALDGARRVILGSNPAGRVVEVTTRDKWLLPQANDVTVTGFSMRHAGTHGQGWAIGNNDQMRFTLRGNVLTDAHGGMVSFGGGDMYTTIADNVIARAGNTGIGGYNNGHGLISGNQIYGNGYGGWRWEWQAGGIKTAASRNLMVTRNTVHDNNGPGIWCDLGCQDVTYADNVVSDLSASGIFFEVSTGARITGNRVQRSGKGDLPGISISSSGNVEVCLLYTSPSPRDS